MNDPDPSPARFDFRAIVRRFVSPVPFLYRRFLEKPVRAGAEIAAVGGILLGGWNLVADLMQRPSRNWLRDNGYALDGSGFLQAIERRDGPAVNHFKWAGIDSPSSAELCRSYASVADLAFLLDNKLVSPRGHCGSGVEGTLERPALDSLCLPADQGCDPASAENLERVAALKRVCGSIPCPSFKAALSESRRSIDSLVSGPAGRLLSGREAFIRECLSNRLGNQERRAQFGGLIDVSPVPVRYNLGYGGGPAEMPASYQSMENCEGRPAAGYEEWGWVIPSVDRYGVYYCVPVPLQRREQQCGQEWEQARDRLAALRRFRDVATP